MINLKIKIIATNDIVLDNRSRDWCTFSYPDHPKGCPNYGKKDTCPPRSSFFQYIIGPPYYIIGVRFDLEGWANKMKKKHPNWSDRQARCCLYWQGKVNKILKDTCNKFFKNNKVCNKVLYKPEATGVHVFETCRKNGIILERNPSKYVWKIAIIGRKIND